MAQNQNSFGFIVILKGNERFEYNKGNAFYYSGFHPVEELVHR